MVRIKNQGGPKRPRPAHRPIRSARTADPKPVQRRRRTPASGLPDAKTLIALYEQMQLIRRFEPAAQVACRKGEMPGFIHLYVGEEADGGRRLRASARRRLDDQHPSRPRPRAGQGRGARRRCWPSCTAGPAAAAAGAAAACTSTSVDVGLFGTNGFVGGGIPATVGVGLQRAHARHRPGRRSPSSATARSITARFTNREFRRRAAAAGGVRLRKQSLRHGHAADHGHAQHRGRHEGRRVRHSRRGGRRQRRAGRVGGRPHGPSPAPAPARAPR